MIGRWSLANREHRMTDICLDRIVRHRPSISKQTAELGKAADATKKNFADTLVQGQTTIGLKPKTGFTAGPTYEAKTLTGQTKAAINNAVNYRQIHAPHPALAHEASW